MYCHEFHLKNFFKLKIYITISTFTSFCPSFLPDSRRLMSFKFHRFFTFVVSGASSDCYYSQDISGKLGFLVIIYSHFLILCCKFSNPELDLVNIQVIFKNFYCKISIDYHFIPQAIQWNIQHSHKDMTTIKKSATKQKVLRNVTSVLKKGQDSSLPE